jgi:hypothetical protein
MANEPSRSDVITEEVEAQGRALRTRRAELKPAAVLDALTATALDARRAELRQARADLDRATIERLGRPS